MFYLKIVNKVLRHCHSLLARQQLFLYVTPKNTDGQLNTYSIREIHQNKNGYKQV